MTRRWFAQNLETTATFWRVLRRDGVTLGFTAHDRNLWFGGILHSASPGMVPSSIRLTADFEPDSAEVRGALSHDTITAADLAEGRFDGAQVRIGLVDWETLESRILYRGAIGTVTEEDGSFAAELSSRKAELLRDPVPRTSPTCRAPFAGPGCGLSGLRFTHETRLAERDFERNAVRTQSAQPASDFAGGFLRWIEGPQAGVAMEIVAEEAGWLILDSALLPGLPANARVILREGCDRTLDTCANRFANAANFQGEPFLPGNDLLSRYPAPPQ